MIVNRVSEEKLAGNVNFFASLISIHTIMVVSAKNKLISLNLTRFYEHWVKELISQSAILYRP